MVDELLGLVRQLAPDAGGVAAIGAVVVYLVRALRAELREQRASRASTATVGARVGALEAELAGIKTALTVHGLSAIGRGRPADDYDDDLADDYDDDEPATVHARVAVPPLPDYPRHRRTA